MAALQLPFQVEYAKSGRAGCRLCKSSIEKESLRIAVMVQSRHHDGRDAHWFHKDCFFKKQKPKSVGDFGNFETLRWNDQEDLTKLVGAGGGGTPGPSSSKGGKKSMGVFSCEYAKSGKSTCAGCDESISKGVVRISKLDESSESAMMIGRAIPRWYHVGCFAKLKDKLEFYDPSPAKIPGFKKLEKPDQLATTTEFKSSAPAKAESVKRKLEETVSSTDEPKPAKAIKLEEAQKSKIKKQMERMYKIRDQLQACVKNGVCKIVELKQILEYNNQELPTPCGESAVLDRLADIMTFGKLERCTICKEGQYTYVSGVGYKCHGYISEFTSCMDITVNPKRTNFEIPPDYQDVMDSINYKFVKVEDREIPIHATPTAQLQNHLMPKLNKSPLKGFSFAIAEECFDAKTLKLMRDTIEKFGGKVHKAISAKTTALICSPGADASAMTKSMVKAEKIKVPALSPAFIQGLSETAGIVDLMKSSLVGDWFKPDDVRPRLLARNESFEKPAATSSRMTERLETKETTARLQLKGGLVVDQNCEVASETHVYKGSGTKGRIYSVVLNKSDIDTGKNSYYKLQLLESDSSKRRSYFVFRSYGRIGTSIGGNITSSSMSLDEAIEMFEEFYLKQTGNVFGKPFVKQPGMYMLMDIKYDEDKEKAVTTALATSKKSVLHMSVQELICLIFDVERMKQTMLEFELDLVKLPLGKISRKQIMDSYGILNAALKLMDDSKGKHDRQITDLTNRFYTMIPHSFGLAQPPLLKDHTMIKEKLDMLESLLDIELAYELLREGDTKEGEGVDKHYASLKAKIEPVEKQSAEFTLIQKYLKNTHASTHQDYGLQIENVFQVHRKGESARYKEFEKLHNKMLLWHGSRTTNFAGILSQGLRIAPPEAPATGYMFGKGVYFADMVSKSANYCFSGPGGTGLLLLCEVALGDMAELKKAKESLRAAPSGKHSVKGMGQTVPNPRDYADLSGVRVPYGKPVKSTTDSDLLYNEYIVYNTAQVNIRYLVRVNFTPPGNHAK